MNAITEILIVTDKPKNDTIPLRISSEDLAMITEAARRKGLSRSAFIRMASLELAEKTLSVPPPRCGGGARHPGRKKP